MTNRNTTYGVTVVRGVQKSKTLKQDTNGYYECVLGAFNVYNSEGKYYPLMPNVKKMFEAGGSLRRRLDNGQCRGEYEHPSPKPNQSNMDFIGRVLNIKSSMVSHHIAKVDLVPGKDDKGRDIVLCMGHVKPSGPYGEALSKELDNPEENVAFSVRSLTNDISAGGRIEKHVNNIVTWDHVNEPGISAATKYGTPTMESIGTGTAVYESMLHQLVASSRSHNLGMEGADSHITRVLTDLGWRSAQIINPSNPKYLTW